MSTVRTVLSATNHQRSSPRPSVSRNSYSDWTDFRGPHNATRALVQIDAHRFFHVQVRGEVLAVEENQEHLEREARLDGVFILQSSAADLDPLAIVTAYKQLLWVERAFRTLKSFLRVRPVYHFTERRIRAYIFLCVLGYLMENHLRQRLLQAGSPYSARAAL
ncbi:MAG: IS1634 family transposase [Candidatus Dormibacteria bacterium]